MMSDSRDVPAPPTASQAILQKYNRVPDRLRCRPGMIEQCQNGLQLQKVELDGGSVATGVTDFHGGIRT